MNLNKALNRERHRDETDVNIIPVMNIFLLLVPFLLLTAAFVKISVIDLSLPSLGGAAGQNLQDEQKPLVLVILAIRETGFQLKSPDFKFDPLAKNNENFDYRGLSAQLKDIKSRHGYAEEIIVSPEAKIKYDVIIKVMDVCRESGFPNVSLAG